MFAVQTKRTFFTRYLASWGSADTEPIRAASGISAADYTPSNGVKTLGIRGATVSCEGD
jgi:hypothetical protein